MEDFGAFICFYGQQPEITLNGHTLTPGDTPVLTEPMKQYQMAGTKGYVLVLPDEAARQLSGDKIRLVMELKNNDYPELKSELNRFLNSAEWTPEIQMGQELQEKVTINVTVKGMGRCQFADGIYSYFVLW